MQRVESLLPLGGVEDRFMAFYKDKFGFFKIRTLAVSDGAQHDILNGTYSIKAAVDVPEYKSFIKVEDAAPYKIYIMDYGLYTKFDLTIPGVTSASYAIIKYLPLNTDIAILTDDPTTNFHIYSLLT